MPKPSLYGLKQSNRDFSLKDTWGKNQFNSSFPAALCCYMADKNIRANYLSVNKGKFTHKQIEIAEIFGINPSSPNVYFAFETAYNPFQKFIIGNIPRTDLVIQDLSNGNKCLSALEIKLTALPDNATCHLSEEKFGSEIVIRPDSIAYLACSIASNNENLQSLMLLNKHSNQIDWSNPKAVIPLFPKIKRALENICNNALTQQPFFIATYLEDGRKIPKIG